MGSKLSSFASPGPKASTEPLVSSDDAEENDIRPAKRRKTANTSDVNVPVPYEIESPRRKPFGHVTNESQRASSRVVEKLQAVQPLDFYRRSHPPSPGCLASPAPRIQSMKSRHNKIGLQKFQFESPVDFKRALRISVLGIRAKSDDAHETLEFAEGRKSPIETQCRCSIALFCAKNDDDPSEPIRSQDYYEIHRTSKIGILRTTFHDGVVMRELFIDPFVLSSYEFYINRKRTTKHGTAHIEFDFGDKYYIQVNLDPLGPQKAWPPFDISTAAEPQLTSDGPLESSPLDLLHAGKVVKNELSLCCNMPGLLEPGRQVRSVDLRLCYGSLKHKVPFGMDIQTQWSLPNGLYQTAVNVSPVESPVVSKTMLTESVSISPLGAKADQSGVQASIAERASRRRSNVPTYNLKALSAQAQGKSPRTRKNNKSRFTQGTDGAESVLVTYGFGRAGAAELGIKQQTSIPGFMCPFCNIDEGSIEDLRLHLHTNHTSFKFSLRRSNSSRVGFFVEIAKQSPRSSPSDQTKTFQLGKPLTLFDLEKFLTGDQSWVKSREGPQHNHWPEHLSDRFQESSLSSSSHDSRHSSPNTPNDTDELVDLEHSLPKRPPRKIYYVPQTSKPLFDTVSKRVLEPGEEIPESDDEKDEAWLHQKHRDIINDFTDLTDEEKEYITRWNPFIVEHHLTSEKYLPDACVRFAQANAAWIVERESRVVEFGKQMETFIIRGIVEQQCLDKCVDILEAAQRRKTNSGKGDVGMEDAPSRPVLPARSRGLFDCICCEPTQPPDRIVCRGHVGGPIALLAASANLAIRNARLGSSTECVQQRRSEIAQECGSATTACLDSSMPSNCCHTHDTPHSMELGLLFCSSFTARITKISVFVKMDCR